MSRTLPPLTALRAFEAAARHLSFTTAATELHVTQAAVSRQVRALELWIGRPLFNRRHRRVELTEDGARLARALVQSFDGLARLLLELKEPGHTLLRVSTEPAFAAYWLVPRLEDFHRAWPHIDVVLDSSVSLADLGPGGMDVAIRYSNDRQHWRGAVAEWLHAVVSFPVLSPKLAAERGLPARPEDLLDYTLLVDNEPEYWLRWFALAGVPAARIRRSMRFNDLALVLDAAKRGLGVALGDDVLAADDLATGRLVRPFDLSLNYGNYWLVRPEEGPRTAAQDAFAAWIKASIAECRPAPGGHGPERSTPDAAPGVG